MRLVTRADFDGLACGAILMDLGIINSWKFAHPKDLQDGKIAVSANDVLANVPYVEGCGIWFDHHASELLRVEGLEIKAEGARYVAPSAARIVYEFYGGVARLPHMEEMVGAVDRVDSARLTKDEILNPTGWVLLGFIIDPRTGLGRHKGFRVGNWELMEELMDACRNYTIDEILMLPNVAERVEFYNKQSNDFKDMLLQYSRVEGEAIVTDVRDVVHIHTGNRFILYSLFPEQNISIWVADGLMGNCMIAMGHSVVTRTSTVDVGKLMTKYGGGGHIQVGTCQVPNEDVDYVISELLEYVNHTHREYEEFV